MIPEVPFPTTCNVCQNLVNSGINYPNLNWLFRRISEPSTACEGSMTWWLGISTIHKCRPPKNYRYFHQNKVGCWHKKSGKPQSETLGFCGLRILRWDALKIKTFTNKYVSPTKSFCVHLCIDQHVYVCVWVYFESKKWSESYVCLYQWA